MFSQIRQSGPRFVIFSSFFQNFRRLWRIQILTYINDKGHLEFVFSWEREIRGRDQIGHFTYREGSIDCTSFIQSGRNNVDLKQYVNIRYTT